MSTERYQSRVFNFLSQQSLRLRDRSAQTWRQVKIVAVWGVQILLYPVYVGFQGSRLIEKQLQQTARQTLPRLQSAKQALQTGQPLFGSSVPTVDLAIQNVLQTASQTVAVSELSTSELSTSELSTLHIQGVASLLDTGSLVLVTSQNQVLNLSFEQQTQLTRRITWETANYWRQRRLLDPLAAQPIVSNFLPPVKAHHHALLPIRVLQKVMAWMQRGSVAVSADLFQESRLVVYQPPQLLLDATDTEPRLRSAQPSWVAMEVQFYDWLEQAGQATTNLLLARLKSGKMTFSELVTRFVERRTASQPLESTSPPDRKTQLPAAQPWLTMEDLFGQADPVRSNLSNNLSNLEAAQNAGEPPIQPTVQQPKHLEVWLNRSLRTILPKPAQLPPTTENPAVWETTDTAALETAIKIKSTHLPQARLPQAKLNRASNRANLAQSPQSPASVERYPSALTEFHTDQHLITPRPFDPLEQTTPLSSLDTANQEEAAMLPQSWVETEAKLVEYVKHPLEQLLEWLDKSMVWLETRLAKVWYWLTRPIE